MNDLLHFVPLTESVTIRGNKIKLRGVDIEDLGQIIYRFPELLPVFKQMIQTRSFDISSAGISNQAMVAMIVAGAGESGNEAMEKSFANLSLGERVDLFKSVFRITAPGGIGPFADLLRAAIGPDAGAIEQEAVAPKKKRAGIKVQVRP
ncbi:hypothetical protein FFI89_018760 [Bradyrhizobium sp. KBS0727]|uniref:hypothetical protein n=1 Tax=unclassified Bradyrhizobium TaxID=2631580 RepID=UPI00110E862A|nr:MULTISPECIES: hypothetical protein [unclassified Bradyrhizobium]QDW39007.1 hypothetical protein FFI71_018760 [Bradyrhizobium sp. KBS0725]QDW45610.1 hypothetical protein FFI89_018760 [Bradyrhizobium sp. KBS0727]